MDIDESKFLPPDVIARRERDREALKQAASMGCDIRKSQAHLEKTYDAELAFYKKLHAEQKRLDDAEKERRSALQSLSIRDVVDGIYPVLNQLKPHKDWKESVEKRVKRATKRKKKRLPLDERTGRVSLPNAARFARNDYPEIEPPWRYRIQLDKSITIPMTSREKAGKPDFSRALIEHVMGYRDNSLLGELRRMVSYIQTVESTLQAEKDKNQRLTARINALEADNRAKAKRLNRKGTGRKPKTDKNKN
jgi:hypothetical protein